MKVSVFIFYHYFINCLLPCAAITKTNYTVVISFPWNKFQFFTYFGSQAGLVWKTNMKLEKNLFESKVVSICGSKARQIYIHRLCIRCLVTGWNLLFLPWNTLYICISDCHTYKNTLQKNKRIMKWKIIDIFSIKFTPRHLRTWKKKIITQKFSI